MTAEKNLIFVYNADSGLFNTLTDIAHKVFSPQTYECNLCAITYGNFGIRTEWKEFLETLQVPLEFLHRDDFKTRYPAMEAQLPAVFVQKPDGPELFISNVEINACRSIAELKQLITERIQ